MNVIEINDYNWKHEKKKERRNNCLSTKLICRCSFLLFSTLIGFTLFYPEIFKIIFNFFNKYLNLKKNNIDIIKNNETENTLNKTYNIVNETYFVYTLNGNDFDQHLPCNVSVWSPWSICIFINSTICGY